MADCSMLRRLTLLLALVFPAAAPAKIPSYRGKFNSLPCLAPYIRQMDPDAPASIEEAMLLPPYQSATLIDGLGKVSFPITTKSPGLQPFFDQGVALLHGMWYSEAERSFRQLAAADPDCPMAYWGLAVANERFPGRAAIYMKQALGSIAKQPGITSKEIEWLQIYHRFWNPEALPEAPGPIDVVRRRARARALEEFATKYPDDLEARAFLLRHLILDNVRAGVPLDSRFLVDLLAEEIFARNPDHPTRHYRAFLWLNENPVRALECAPQITSIAPSNPDSWRYAADLHAAAGQHEAALYLQDAGLRVAHRRMITDLLTPDETDNLAANYAAHIDTLCSMGRLREATAAAHRLIAFPRTAYLRKADTLEDQLAGCHATGRRHLFETLARQDRWQNIVDEVDSGALKPGSDWTSRAHSLYWRAIALSRLNDEPAAAAALEALDNLFNDFRARGTTNEVKEEIVRCIRSLRTYRDVAARSLAEAPDFTSEPLHHITGDHLALLLFEAGLYPEALTVITQHYAERHGQLLSTALFCDLYAHAGRGDEALIHFDSNFRRNATAADPGLALFDRVTPMVQALKLRGNWKLPVAPFDASAHPDPESIGPETWSPPTAPAFSLSDHEGKKIDLEDYRGKPVLLNFFLGVGCVFCAEQLQVFKPHLEAFANAGISFVAVSIDSVDGLAQSIGAAIAEGGEKANPYPFPILSDESLEVFKAYRAYSDFEEDGLHGTFLIGPMGEILWHNVSHEPFMFPEFLLEEATRLLAQPE